MNKKIIVAVALCIAAFANAQEAVISKQGIKFGVKAGLNISNLTGDIGYLEMYPDEEIEESRVGFHFGAVAEIKLNERFSIQTEAVYSTQGARSEKETIQRETYQTRYKMDYLTVPIMAKYYVLERLSVEAGPQVAFLLKAEQELQEGFLGTTTTTIDDELNGLDLGLNVGLGYELPKHFFVQARYTIGLSNVLKDIDYAKIYNGVFQLSLGYTF